MAEPYSTAQQKRHKRLKQLPPRDHLAAIGAVAVFWTAIESLMETTILGLYEIDLGRGLVLTTNLSFHSRLSLLRILAAENGAIKDETVRLEANELFNEIDRGYGDRNGIVHALWGMSDKPGVVHRLSLRARGKKLQTISQDYTASDLWQIAGQLGDLLRRFADLDERLGIKEMLEAAPRHSTTSR